MKHSIRTVFIMFLLPYYLLSSSLVEKYPSYEYVFTEFGIDETYIFDFDFEKFVLDNEKNIKLFYDRSMKRGDALLPVIREKLMDDGLSDLFIYISMVESGFSPDIVSPKKAVGLWQFMPATAKHYNLSVCSSFDERCDPVSSTNAAITYLRKLHKQFGKWYLAIMAYNCGEGRLEKAIKKANSNELDVLIDNDAKYLPLETREYIKKILLVAMIGEGEVLDFESKSSLDSKSIIQVEVHAGTKLEKLAKCIGMKASELLNLNKQFDEGLVPKENLFYKIMIPEEKIVNFYIKCEFTEEKKMIKPHLLSHYVKLGETLQGIAEQYDATIEEIKRVNHLNGDMLELDKLLLIPISEALFEEILTDQE